MAADGPADIKKICDVTITTNKKEREKEVGKVLAPFVETVTTVYKQKHTERKRVCEETTRPLK